MNRIVKNSLILGGLLLASTSLIVYFRNQFKKLADSCYTVVGGIIHNISLNDVKISLIFQIKNNSDISVNVENVEFKIFVNNLFVTKILKKQKQKLLSHSSVTFNLDVQFSPQDLMRAGLASIESLIVDRSKLVIGIKGNFDAELGIVKIKQYQFDEKISLKELLKPSENKKKC